MSRVKKLLSLVLVGAFIFSLVLATGCARHPNDEQIQALEEARSACLSAEEKLNATQQERENLEKQLAQAKAELDDLKKEKDLVQERINNWSTENE